MNEATQSVSSDRQNEALKSTPSSPPGFDLLNEVGRGGMGVVFRANDRALGREVAVKLLQQRFEPGSTTASRFVEEARITAQLQHPGVPAVYQVGKFDDGRPFLAMKLIKGDTLDHLIKAGMPLDTLAIFEAIAHTVGFAHARGVIHRDLKPANVMVGAFGEVQVMDWGLSKVMVDNEPQPHGANADPEATTGPTEIRSLRPSDGDLTEAGRILGTPAYMSPEQAAGETDKIDARSDVFGLGAILCAMLTAKPPLNGDDVESVRLNAVRGRTELAFARLNLCGADPDVVALCKKCLAFERENRPANADAVALTVASLRRTADERAKQAEHDRLAAEVRTSEQIKRRRAIQRWATAAGAVLLFGIAGTSAGLFWADKERRTAVAKEREAVRVVEFFQKRVLAAPRPKGKQGGLGKDVSLREAIAAALPALDQEFKDQPLVEARLRQALGTTLWQLGHYPDAYSQHERSHAVLSDLLGTEHPETLIVASHMGNGLVRLGKADEAVKLHQQVLEARTRTLGPHHEATVTSMDHLAFAFTELDRHSEALPLQEKVLEARKRLLGAEHEETLASANNLAVNYAGLNREADALKLREEWLPKFERVHPPDHVDRIAFQSNLANSYFEAGRHEDALKLRRKVLDVRSRALGRDHPDTLHSLCGLAQVLLAMGRGAEAIPYVDECCSHAKRADPMILSLALAVRLRHFQKMGNADGCRRTAEMWEALGRTKGDDYVDGACFRAVAAALYAKSNMLAEAKLDADKAMAWLQKSVAAGFKDVAHMKKDSDLDYLRNREDFKQLMASLEKSNPPKKSK
jgi:eukaryotic-like serine/threonine-protein kinase